jgi:hypothetical protein
MFGSAQETATEKGPNAAKEDTRRPDNSAPAAESTAVGRPKTVGLDGGELWWTKLEEFKEAGGSYGLLPQRLDDWEDEQRHRSLGHVQIQALIGAKFEFDKRKETWDWIRSFRHCFRLQNSHDVVSRFATECRKTAYTFASPFCSPTCGCYILALRKRPMLGLMTKELCMQKESCSASVFKVSIALALTGA